MFELHNEGLAGDAGWLRNHQSLTSKHMNSLPMRFQNRPNRTTKIMSVRRIDSRPQSIMPKTAINFYNLRKGLYLKNGAHNGSISRAGSIKVMSTNERNSTTAKSTGLLNAYGELAAQELEVGGGIATQANLFHHNKLHKGENASDMQSAVSPKTMTSTTAFAQTDVGAPITPVIESQTTPQQRKNLSAVELSANYTEPHI